MLFLRGSIISPTERAQFLLKISPKDFQNSPPFERSACFYVTVPENIEPIQDFNLNKSFENKKPFSKKWSTNFKTQHFHAKLSRQKPI